MRRLTLLAAVVVLAGCGGGSHRLSAKDYRAKATRICVDAKRQTDALGRPDTTRQFKVFITKGIVVIDRNVRRFAALKPPADLQRDHDAIVASQRRGLDQFRRLATKLHGDSRDVALLRAVQPALKRISDESDARFRAAGLDQCAQS